MGDSIADAMLPKDPLGDFINEQLEAQRRRDMYGIASAPAARYVRFGESGSQLRAEANWRARVNEGIATAADLERLKFDVPARFEGTQFAGAASAPSELFKVGASESLRAQKRGLYQGLEYLSAALSGGNQDPSRIAELRNAGLSQIDAYRKAVQADPALQQELLARGLTFRGDIDRIGQLGAFGDPQTVHLIAAATAQAGGVGRATAEGIATKMGELAQLSPSFVARIPGDASVEAAAPGLYLNTLLGMRGHVDSTMLYVASMNDAQMRQLGSYTDTVMSAGGLTRYKDNEGIAAAWMGMQTTAAGMQRVGEGLSVVGMGLRNFSSSLVESFRNSSVDISQIGGALRRYGIPFPEPMYVVPPGPTTVGGRATFATNQLDAKFKHADQFGVVTTKKNPETLAQYEQALRAHLDDAATYVHGTYLYVPNSVVHFNPNTNNVVVMTDSNAFVSGWRLAPGTPQYTKYLKDGVLR